MKVLLPTEYYPPFVIGGGEISTKLLVEGLAREGVEVHVLTPNYESFSNTVSGKRAFIYTIFEVYGSSSAKDAKRFRSATEEEGPCFTGF